MKRIDAHCHLFNVQYALREVVSGVWDLVCGNYPHKDENPVSILDGESYNLKSGHIELQIDSLLPYVTSLLGVALRDAEQGYEFIQENYEESTINNGETLDAVPLMMDIYYFFDSGNYADSKPEIKLTNLGSMISTFCELAPFIVEKALESLAESGINIDGVMEECEKVFYEFLERIPKLFLNMLFSGDETTTEMSWGFKKHMEELERLQAANSDSIYPFLAVDPRRKGIADLVKEKVSKEGPFYGVKLYTAMGYLPTHPVLDEVCQYCNDNEIPVTVHCSTIGMSSPLSEIRVKSGSETFDVTFEDTDDFSAQAMYFGDPSKWGAVLEKYSNLKLNFAHFGGEEEIEKKLRIDNDDENLNLSYTNWVESIMSLMSTYDNVYADISYTPKTDSRANIKILIDTYPALQDRLLFGTDYLVTMIEIGDLTKHFDRFKDYGFEEDYDYPFTQPDVYSNELIDKMTIKNVRDFLFS